MNDTISIGIYRIFGRELEIPIDDDEVKLKLHNKRKVALHETFDNQEEIVVNHWGQTDDEQPHEYVEIIVSAGATLFVNHVVIPVAKKIFEKLADKAIDTVLEKSVSWILSKFKKKQEEKKIGEYSITLPNGTLLRVTNPKEGSKIIFYVNEEPQEVQFLG